MWRCAGVPPSQPGVEGAVEAGAPAPDLSPLEPLPPSVNVEELQRRISESFSRKLAEWERRKYRRPTTPEMEHRGWRIRKEKEERTRSKKSREEKERERQEKAREREMQKVEKEQVSSLLPFPALLRVKNIVPPALVLRLSTASSW